MTTVLAPKQIPTRQRARRALILLSLLLFPITINFFSPYLIIDSGAQGILNGSAIVFSLMALSSLFFGRLWCGWACPAAGLQEALFAANNQPVTRRKLDPLKWAIWIPWLSLIVFVVLRAGGYRQVNFLYLTESGVSVDEPAKYIVYLTVVLLFGLAALFLGKRAGCHSFCWMAPFMILGRKLRNLAAWPSLRLTANAAACHNCKKCSRECPMSLDVNALVHSASMESSECILCGTCVDGCPESAIRYTFSAGR